MSKFGARKGLLQRPSKKNEQVILKNPELSDSYQGRAKFWVWATGCVTFFWLIRGDVKKLPSSYLVLSLRLPTSTWLGASFLQKNSETLIHSSFVSHSLPYVISNCLNLPFGTQGWSRRLKPANKKQGQGKTSVPGKTPLGPALLQSHLFLDTLQPWEEEILDEEGNNDLDWEVSHKFSRGAQF